ncbi:hypothetical protein M0813_27034 [Anaeramoeba flamelloides]|uniref:Uracil-DNA glycosylase-like domain-containing protein n=1 Tax=Anaeramoeba flamelloides TaxID=1746091 RepID=A0ABQ8XXZ1_9EUKA|nr:hypothetical protein M0813_27034 [Anaeramoeba flamelloides]
MITRSRTIIKLIGNEKIEFFELDQRSKKNYFKTIQSNSTGVLNNNNTRKRRLEKEKENITKSRVILELPNKQKQIKSIEIVRKKKIILQKQKIQKIDAKILDKDKNDLEIEVTEELEDKCLRKQGKKRNRTNKGQKSKKGNDKKKRKSKIKKTDQTQYKMLEEKKDSQQELLDIPIIELLKMDLGNEFELESKFQKEKKEKRRRRRKKKRKRKRKKRRKLKRKIRDQIKKKTKKKNYSINHAKEIQNVQTQRETRSQKRGEKKNKKKKKDQKQSTLTKEKEIKNIEEDLELSDIPLKDLINLDLDFEMRKSSVLEKTKEEKKRKKKKIRQLKIKKTGRIIKRFTNKKSLNISKKQRNEFIRITRGRRQKKIPKGIKRNNCREKTNRQKTRQKKNNKKKSIQKKKQTQQKKKEIVLVEQKPIKFPFQPIINKECKALILGTFPGPKSVQNNFYFSYSANSFWPIMNSILSKKPKQINTKLIAEEKEYYTNLLLSNHISLYVLIQTVIRKKIDSADSSLKIIEMTDLDLLIKQYPKIETILFTNQFATKLFKKHFQNINLPCFTLPSPSSRNARMKVSEKREKYLEIFKKLKICN